MTTPRSKLFGNGKPGDPASEATPADGAPPHDEARPGEALYDQSPLEVPLAEAPPRRSPPPPPSARASSGSGTVVANASPGASPDPTAERQSVDASSGFSALLEHTSLREQLLRIEFAQCDAIVTVGSDLGRGRVWCVAGNVIDAEWQREGVNSAVRGEAAVLQILTLREGEVSVAFVPVNRPRLIALSTRELLGRALLRTTRPFAELESTGVRPSVQPSQRTTLFYRPETSGVFPNSLPPSVAPRNKVSLNTYLAGGVAVLALLITAIGIRQLSTPEDEASVAREQVHVGTLKAGPSPEAVTIEVVPAEAQIWLDSKLVGTGSISQGPVRDGLVHQLRFVAPGYAPKSIFFRDLPAPGTVTLEPMAAADMSLKKAAEAVSTLPRARPSATSSAPRLVQDAPAATSGAKLTEGLTSTETPVVSQSRSAESGIATPIDRSPERRTSEAKRHSASVQRPAPAPQVKPPPEPVKPQVQVIEVRTPRVQVID
jgi:hypothetical protein